MRYRFSAINISKKGELVLKQLFIIFPIENTLKGVISMSTKTFCYFNLDQILKLLFCDFIIL